MNFLLLVAFIGGVLIALKSISKKHSSPLPYYRKKTLLNGKEQVLFHRLTEAMPNCYVLAQVRLADIVGIKKTQNRQGWFNKVSRKSVDFVICSKSFSILACIELDGKTHEQESRQKADGDKDAALKAAGIPIIRIKASELASVDEIKSMLEKELVH